jgi:hypothetical protein
MISKLKIESWSEESEMILDDSQVKVEGWSEESVIKKVLFIN